MTSSGQGEKAIWSHPVGGCHNSSQTVPHVMNLNSLILGKSDSKIFFAFKCIFKLYYIVLICYDVWILQRLYVCTKLKAWKPCKLPWCVQIYFSANCRKKIVAHFIRNVPNFFNEVFTLSYPMGSLRAEVWLEQWYQSEVSITSNL